MTDRTRDLIAAFVLGMSSTYIAITIAAVLGLLLGGVS